MAVGVHRVDDEADARVQSFAKNGEQKRESDGHSIGGEIGIGLKSTEWI